MSSFVNYVYDYIYHLIGFIIVAGLLIAFHLRRRWLPVFQEWQRRRASGLYLPIVSEGFQDDINSGLTSGTFDLLANNRNDSRKGLDNLAKKEIVSLMNERGLTFDQARAEYTQEQMRNNQIGPDGMPLDPKAFTFS